MKASSSENVALTVRILDKDYQVNSPTDAQQALLNSALLLDERMRDIRGSGKVIGTERIAVMAALNIAYELLQMRGSDQGDLLSQERLRDIRERIDATLERAREQREAKQAAAAEDEAKTTEAE